jgi:hypothetical protein
MGPAQSASQQLAQLASQPAQPASPVQPAAQPTQPGRRGFEIVGFRLSMFVVSSICGFLDVSIARMFEIDFCIYVLQ